MAELALTNLLYWSLQATLIVGGAALAARLMPVDAPGVRHAWWRAVLVVCLVLPLLQPWQGVTWRFIDPSQDLSLLAGTSSGVMSSFVLRGMAAPLQGQLSIARLVALILATGILLRLCWLASGLVRLRRLRRAGAPAVVDDDLRHLVPARASIMVVDGVGQPATFGLRHPVVLLPSAMRELPAAVQKAVLAHELLHVRRRDWIWTMGEELVRSALWFHPAMWWLISRVQSSREEVVDELAVLLTNARRSYLEALLAFADEAPLFPAAPFARRRHLYQRMLLLSREAVMSSRRIIASCAGMLLVAAIGGWYGVSAFPLVSPAQSQTPPRDPKPGEARPPTNQEQELKSAIAAGGQEPGVYLDLAKLQQERGAMAEAEATLEALFQAHPQSVASYHALAQLYVRTGRVDRAIALLEDAAARSASDPNAYHMLGTFYWEAARGDSASPMDRLTYLHAGAAAEDRALALKPDFVEALVYKNLFLRQEAAIEGDTPKGRALLAEADALRSKAMAMRATQPPPSAAQMRTPGMPPPPPPPPPPGDREVPNAIRLAAGQQPPVKIKDAKPEYPQDAKDAGVQGIVILDATIDEQGDVANVRVVRSVPMLDQAAMDAVREWKFQPALLNGKPVAVIVTMTVNFTLK
jgi:TonB family protein